MEEMKDMTTEEKREFIKKTMGPVDGIFLPSNMIFNAIYGGVGKPWAEKMEDLRNMTLRDDDVFLLTYPKAGWVQQMMEFVDVDVMDALPSPRNLNGHIPFSMLPVPEMKRRRCKVVHVYRNPKDSCVSRYHMVRSAPLMRLMSPCETFEDFFHYFFVGTDYSEKVGTCYELSVLFSVNYGSYFRHLRQMYDVQQGNPDIPFFNLSFEESKKDPVGCVQRLATFLELDVSHDLCLEIADQCSFDSMKKRDAQKAEIRNMGAPTIYRKGEAGDWKNYFTVAMSEQADVIIQREMADLSQSYPFTFQ